MVACGYTDTQMPSQYSRTPARAIGPFCIHFLQSYAYTFAVVRSFTGWYSAHFVLSDVNHIVLRCDTHFFYYVHYKYHSRVKWTAWEKKNKFTHSGTHRERIEGERNKAKREKRKMSVLFVTMQNLITRGKKMFSNHVVRSHMWVCVCAFCSWELLNIHGNAAFIFGIWFVFCSSLTF